MSQAPPAAGQTPKPKAASPVKFKAELRRATRRNNKEAEVNYLNITAMMDMMTIILVFLLKSASSSNAAPPQNEDLRLPKSVMLGQPTEEGVPIIISKSQIIVGDNDRSPIPLPSREAMAQSGVDARFKRGGPNDLYIVPLGSKLQHIYEIDKVVRDAKRAADPTKGDVAEAVIIADGTTPFRLLLEVLFTLGQERFGRFHLMVISGSAPKQLPELPPSPTHSPFLFAEKGCLLFVPTHPAPAAAQHPCVHFRKTQ
jgi:hypothetical protein